MSTLCSWSYGQLIDKTIEKPDERPDKSERDFWNSSTIGPCPRCHKQLKKSVNSKKNHYKTEHPNVYYYLGRCPLLSPTEKRISETLGSHGKGNRRCTFCTGTVVSFGSRQLLIEHLGKAHPTVRDRFVEKYRENFEENIENRVVDEDFHLMLMGGKVAKKRLRDELKTGSSDNAAIQRAAVPPPGLALIHRPLASPSPAIIPPPIVFIQIMTPPASPAVVHFPVPVPAAPTPAPVQVPAPAPPCCTLCRHAHSTESCLRYRAPADRAARLKDLFLCPSCLRGNCGACKAEKCALCSTPSRHVWHHPVLCPKRSPPSV